jgi:hypothetical protein
MGARTHETVSQFTLGCATYGRKGVATSRQFDISCHLNMCKRRSRGSTQYKCLTVIRDALTLVYCSDKGKPVERRGRKATGLKDVFL